MFTLIVCMNSLNESLLYGSEILFTFNKKIMTPCTLKHDLWSSDDLKFWLSLSSITCSFLFFLLAILIWLKESKSVYFVYFMQCVLFFKCCQCTSPEMVINHCKVSRTNICSFLPSVTWRREPPSHANHYVNKLIINTKPRCHFISNVV